MSQPPPSPVPSLDYAKRAACPKCGSQDWKPVIFTWWGGLLGPKLLHHVRCANCRSTFNSKTGYSNLKVIIAYQAIALGATLLVLAGIYIARR